MDKRGPCESYRVADVECDARIALPAVPVTPIALEIADGEGDLIGGGFDFLQADDVRALTLNPFLDLRVSRPDAVDVPGRDLQEKFGCAAARSAAGIAMMSGRAAMWAWTIASACAMVSGSPLR